MPSAIDFTLNLIDKMSGPAKAATLALSALESQLKSVKGLVGDLGKLSIKVPAATSAAHGGQSVATKAAKSEQLKLARSAEQLDKQRARALYAEYQKQERSKAVGHAVAAVQAHVGGGPQAAQLAGTLKEIAELAGGHGLLNLASTLGAPLRGVYGLKQAFYELGEGFEHITGISPAAAAGVAGVAAAAVIAAAGVVKLAEGLGELVIEGAHMAIEAVEAKEKTLDLLSAMLGSEEAAQRVVSAISDITKVTGIGSSRVAQLSRELAAAGESGDLLTDSMRAIAQAETVLPEAGEKLQKLTERAIQTGKFTLSPKQLVGTGLQTQKLYEEISRRTGVGVKQVEAQLKSGKIKAETGIAALNAVISNKFGGVAAKQAMDLDVQLQRFHDNVGKLFKDVHVEGFLNALQSILSIVDQATPAGAALHDVLSAAFDGLFKAAEAVIPYIKVALKGLVIIGLQIAIALKPLMRQLGATFGKDQQAGPQKLAEWMSMVGEAAGFVVSKMIALGPAFSLVGSAIMFTVSWGLRLVEGMFALLAVAATVETAIVGFGLAAVDAGKNVVTGLIQGIENAASQLYDTVVNLAETALSKFKEKFGIHSPSRVMAKMGGHLSAGLAGGIHAGAKASTGAMVGAGAHMSAHAGAGLSAGLREHAVLRASAGARAGIGIGVGARAGIGAHAGLGDPYRAAPQLEHTRRLELPHLAGNDNARPLPQAEPARLADKRGEKRGHGGAPSLHMEAGAVVINGVTGAADLEDKFPQMMADWWERQALQTGTGD